ncbi:MAG TPA: FAD binding domain-containing protein [Myxococcota bacterium]|nr:FAD binding domain-containing protein [Myxococcota bacterium]HRY91826.1 FAD binding domain-containing protein [Myxococcota bacterium]HSA21470.1 FAD binding domain-containing protein [Myxococcota bacterium]
MPSFLSLTSLEDVAEMLWAEGPTCALVAGGTDLLVRAPRPERTLWLDISRCAELAGIGLDAQGRLRVGALACHQEVVEHPLVRRHARLLGLACASVGSLQIRNRGTLGGNLGNASPAADTLPALVCLGASVRLVARQGAREVPVSELYTGPGQTVLRPDELIESVRVPLRRGRAAACFKKAGQRKGMCCSKASVALDARVRPGLRLVDVRVAMGAVAPTVLGVPAAEALLEGQRLSPRLIAQAAEACVAAARPIDDLRSSAGYRRAVVGALLSEGLLEILERLRRAERRAEGLRRARRARGRGRR